ncbi:unnamed protein product [Menidia menidia]|uniref:(Atlantic silverside) hypothetical protein n=1 Tax=Menidia menidia TaxID=238744 RepID=A0A8S4AC57_9TELE|nr:unnamed protein product [Menidia menidia]
MEQTAKRKLVADGEIRYSLLANALFSDDTDLKSISRVHVSLCGGDEHIFDQLDGLFLSQGNVLHTLHVLKTNLGSKDEAQCFCVHTPVGMESMPTQKVWYPLSHMSQNIISSSWWGCWHTVQVLHSMHCQRVPKLLAEGVTASGTVP